MSLLSESVTVLKPTRVTDGSGGKTETFTAIWTGTGTQNFYTKTSLERLEQSTHSAQGPGVLTRTLKLWTFEAPGFPPFSATTGRDYRIKDSGGAQWRVLYVRTYEMTMQVDTELVA